MWYFSLCQWRPLWLLTARLFSNNTTSLRLSLLNIQIADINFVLCSKDLPILNEPQSLSYQNFYVVKAEPDTESVLIELISERKDFPEAGAMREIFEDCGSWAMFKNSDHYALVLNPSLSDGYDCIAFFRQDIREVALYCGDINIVEIGGKKFIRNPFTYPLDQLLLMYVLAVKQGALIHASGVNYNGKGYIFCGKSGAGKSTLSRKFELHGHEVLSDDRIAVRKIKEDFRMFGTPWSGEAGIAKNKDLPLQGIFFIRHGEENTVRKILPAEAVERLMPVTSIPWYDKSALNQILIFFDEFVSACPAYDLCFRPDISPHEIFRELIP